MSWQVRIPGQPPSVNHMYERGYRKIRKSPGAEAYQAAATLIVRTSRPSGWTYESGFVRLVYDLHLKRDIDCDNILKALNDAIAVGLGMNDRYFLPCVRSKEIGVQNPYVDITVEYAT